MSGPHTQRSNQSWTWTRASQHRQVREGVPMPEDSETIKRHYGSRGLGERILAAVREAGHDPDNLTPEILAPMDHLHSGGFATTRAQIAKLKFSPEMRVLDVGCGIGGPARYLAKTVGCHVTGIDLTEEFVEVARMLAHRCGLSRNTEFHQGNALELPFEDNSFDVVWCQNVTMNIANKAELLAQIHRVLKPGGKFTYTEYVSGRGGQPVYPVPWAHDPSYSFIVTPEEMRDMVEESGFRVLEWTDFTVTNLEWARDAIERAKARPPNPLGTQTILCEDLKDRQRNNMRNMSENRLIYILVVAERPSPNL